jgi:hypothetical protein
MSTGIHTQRQNPPTHCSQYAQTSAHTSKAQRREQRAGLIRLLVENLNLIRILPNVRVNGLLDQVPLAARDPQDEVVERRSPQNIYMIRYSNMSAFTLQRVEYTIDTYPY